MESLNRRWTVDSHILYWGVQYLVPYKPPRLQCYSRSLIESGRISGCNGIIYV